jgi:hypothetical protein
MDQYISSFSLLLTPFGIALSIMFGFRIKFVDKEFADNRISARLLPNVTILIVRVSLLDIGHTLDWLSELKSGRHFRPNFAQLKIGWSKE